VRRVSHATEQPRSAKMPIEPSLGVVRSHNLSHLPVLQVGKSIRDCRMSAACDSTSCQSTCCGTGVLADLKERDLVLSHVDEVRRAMDADQEKDPAKWFDGEEIADTDFPSGVAVGTQTNERGCIFLNAKGRCVLQKATAEGIAKVVLKPFYCFAFPLTVDRGTLVMDVDNVEGTTRCCVPVPDGERSVLDVFEGELIHILGLDGFGELRAVVEGAPPGPKPTTG
jgi:hypothetical protein